MSAPWLDALPKDILERIAAHTTHGTLTDAGLTLAEFSPMQHRAVLHSLSLTYAQHIPFHLALHANRLSRWEHLLFHSLREFRTTTPSNTDISTIPAALLAAPRLSRAKIVDHPSLLRALTRSKGIAELEIDLWYCRFNVLVLETLAIVRPTKLTLNHVCTEEHVDGCLICNKIYLPPHDPSFSESCANVQSLSVSCSTCRSEQAAVWQSVQHFTVLSHFSFEGLVPNQHAISNLRSIEEVNVRIIDDGSRSWGTWTCAGGIVTAFTTTQFLSREKLSYLSKYPKIQLLKLKIDSRCGAENVLQSVVHSLSFLTELRIEWGTPRDFHEHEEDGIDFDEEIIERDPKPIARVKPGLLASALQSARQLTKLELGQVWVASEELLVVLRSVGDRLEFFRTSITGQEEPPLLRLERILLIATEWNPSLKNLSVASERIAIEKENDRIPTKLRMKQGCRVRLALKRLRVRAPFLQVGDADILAFAYGH